MPEMAASVAVSKYGAITGSLVERFDAWFKERCTYAPSGIFSKEFRDLVLENFMPVGAMFQCQRTSESQAIRGMPMSVLQQEIGSNKTSFAIAAGSVSPKDLLAEPPSRELYVAVARELMPLAMFEHLIQQTNHVAFRKHYRLTMREVELDPVAALDRLVGARRAFDPPRRPVILQLCEKWWVHEQGQIIACPGGSKEALLRWMTIVSAREYDCKTAEGISMKPFIAQFIQMESK